MSTVLLGLCWPLQMGPSEKIVIISLADQANDAGVCWPSRESIARRTSLSERQCRRSLSVLEREGYVTRTYRMHRSTVYQFTAKVMGDRGVGDTESRVGDIMAGVGATVADQGGHTVPQNHHRTTNEPSFSLSGKPDVVPNGHDYLTQAREILNYLNRNSGRAYRPVDANLKLIVARLKSGATPLQCREVVHAKCDQWGRDEKMAEYLRPATLFNATKFEQYLGEIGGGTHG